MFSWFRRKIINFFDWLFSFGKQNSSAIPSSQTLSSSGNNPDPIETNIRIIGDRDCGKTTYLAALIRNPNHDPNTSPVQKIVPASSSSEQLENQATNILEKGQRFLPTTPLKQQQQARQLVEFSFDIFLKDKRSRLQKLEISCKDYPGEVIDDVHKNLDSYVEDCAEKTVEGIMLLLDATKHNDDEKFEISIRTFLRRLLPSRLGGWKGKIAITLTKCEDKHIYGKRRQLKSSKLLLERYFPKTLQAIKNNISDGIEIEYFSLSAFGMTGPEEAKRPNVEYVRDATTNTIEYARLKYPGVWQPFGLIAPLYWLCTGDRYHNLDSD